MSTVGDFEINLGGGHIFIAHQNELAHRISKSKQARGPHLDREPWVGQLDNPVCLTGYIEPILDTIVGMW